jgi:hypothetical protein
VANRRDPYYRWLYGSNAVLGARRRSSPEAIEFYTVKPMPFDSDKGIDLDRERRKVGADHALDRGKLLLN